MSRRRNKQNKGLPARWRFYHGAYRYSVPKGQEAQWDGKQQFTLGKTLAEAYRVWAERVELRDNITTVDQLLDRYALEVIPKKAKRTQKENRRQLPILRKRFGKARVAGDIKPHHIYEYVSKNSHRLTAAHREIEVLSHAFTMAVQWGIIHKHPWRKEVRFDKELSPKPAERSIEDWEVIEALKLKPRRKRGSVLMCQAYVRLKLLTGLRQTDLLSIKLLDMDDIGLKVGHSKTGHKQHFTWLDKNGNETGLRDAVKMAKAARPVDLGPWLFCNRRGECYLNDDKVANGFQSIWGRFMQRVLRETGLVERFAERDLRAKVATDADSLERARELLGHADAALTKRVYVRRAQLVQPAKGLK